MQALGKTAGGQTQSMSRLERCGVASFGVCCCKVLENWCGMLCHVVAQLHSLNYYSKFFASLLVELLVLPYLLTYLLTQFQNLSPTISQYCPLQERATIMMVIEINDGNDDAATPHRPAVSFARTKRLSPDEHLRITEQFFRVCFM